MSPEKRGEFSTVFCKQCGTQLSQNDKFCPGCGAPVAAPAPEAAPVGLVAPAPDNPLLAQRTNPLFLAAVICESVVAVFTLINLFLALGSLGHMGDVYMSMTDLDRASEALFSGMLDSMSAIMIVTVLGSLTITAVILTGLWMTYASGLGQGKDSTLVRGLKLVRGGVLAEMIYMIVGLSLLALASLFLIGVGNVMNAAYDSYGSYAYRPSNYAEGKAVAGLLNIVGLVLLLFAVVAGVLMVIFYVKARRAVGFALGAAQTGKVTGVPALYLAVMCFVIGGFSLLSLLLGASNALSAVSTLVSAAGYILFGVVAVQYRSRAAAQLTA